MPFGDNDVVVGNGDPILGATRPSVKEAQDIGDSIIAGLQSSATGLAVRGKMPSMQLGTDAPWYHRIAAGGANLLADLPLSIGGAFAGMAAGTAVAPGPGTVVGGGAGAFAVPMALREALMTAYNSNHASSWEGVWDIAKNALIGGAKGAVIGGATMGAGRAVAPLVAPIAGKAVLGGGLSASGARYAVDAAALGTEISALTGTAAALEGKMPTWQDFMDNAILLGGMKGAVGIAKGMRAVYAETGRTPEQILGDAQRDPTILLDLKPVETPSGEKVVAAFHGSPYEFTAFDASKIGTGEGAQAYGHGLYFAESKGVAESYASIRGTGLTQDQLSQYFTPGRKVAPYGTREKIDTILNYDAQTGLVTVERTEHGETHQVAYRDTGADKLKVIAEIGEPKASLYKVEIPQRVVNLMLDWDAPLSAQPDAVKKLLKAGGINPDGLLLSKGADLLNGPWLDQVVKREGLSLDREGKSAFLKSIGIPGVKYFDQASRSSKEGTRNFVVFDANNVRILERNGDPLAVPNAYKAAGLEERIKAAIDANPKPELIRELLTKPADEPAKLGADPAVDPVKYEYITDKESAKGVLRAVTQMYENEIAAQTRGVVPNKQTARDALNAVSDGVVGEHVVGEAGNAAEIYARAHMLKGAANHAAAELEKIAGIPEADLTPAMKLSALAAIERVAMLKAEVEGVGAEAGRALQILGAIKRDPSFLGEAETLLKLAERKGALQDIAALSRAFKDSAQMADFARGYTQATTVEKMLEVWKAAILTGPQTHLANIAGNIMKWMVELPENILAASITAGKRAIAGDPLTMAQFKARALAPVYGLQMGAVDALKIAAEVWKQKGEHVEKADVFRGAIEGKAGEIIRLPFKALQVEDVLFRTVAERAEAHIMAVDRVVKDGFNPDSLEGQSKIAEYTNRPEAGLEQQAGLDAIKRVQDAGAEAVFSQRLGPRMEQVQRAMAGSPMGFIIPFFRTPANLVSWAIQHVPALNLLSGRWRADWDAGGERQARAASRVIVGGALSMTAFSLASQGLITGGGMFEKEEGNAKRAAGWQPYSLKIGDKYYSYQRIEPVAKVLGLAVDINDMLRITKDEGDKAKLVSMAVLMFGNATISTTYLSGLSNALQSVTDPTRYGENFLEQYASSLVPKIVGQTVTAADPYKREVSGILDAVQSQLPFLREKLMPKRDVWGEPVANDKWFDVMPVSVTQEDKDFVKQEAVRLHLAIANAPKFVMERGPFKAKDKRIDLSPEQRDVFAETMGKNAMTILAPIVNAPDWKQIPDFAKAAIYQKVFEGTRKQGQYEALPPEGEERMKKRQEIVGKILKQVQDAETK